MLRYENICLRVALALLVGVWAASFAGVAAADDAAGEFSIPFATDSGGHVLDGSAGRYTFTFAAGELPPVTGRWSLSVYSLPEQLLVPNPIGRYEVDSSMLPNLERDADGGLTIYLEKDAPGSEREANWLPTPDGPFLVILRLYGAEQAVLDNAWEAPPVERVETRAK